MEVPVPLSTVRALITDDKGAVLGSHDFNLVGALGTQLPFSFGVVAPPEDLDSAVIVQISALETATASRSLFTRRAVTRFVPNKSLLLPMYLPSACRSLDCGAQQTCTENGCQSVFVEPSTLQESTGSPGDLVIRVNTRAADAGMVMDANDIEDAEASDQGTRNDAGAADAEPPIDAGMPKDAASADAGTVPLASPGTYVYNRIPITSITNRDINNISMARDGRSMIISVQGRPDICVLDVPTTGTTVCTTLPVPAGDTTYITDIKHAPNDRFVLLTAYTIPSTGPRTARLYRADPDGQNIIEISGESIQGREFHAVALDDASGEIAVLSTAEYNTPRDIQLHTYVDATRSFSAVATGTASVGCDDLAWATDRFNQKSLVYVCGRNGAQVGHYDSTGRFLNSTLNTGNVSKISPRPQGDYALAVGWSGSGSLLRFERGHWSSVRGFAISTIWGISFSDDGARALISGRARGNTGFMNVFEYRHGFFDAADVTDVSIPDFTSAPYNGTSNSYLFESAWRPGLDCGYMVGTDGMLVEFKVTNGRRPCP